MQNQSPLNYEIKDGTDWIWLALPQYGRKPTACRLAFFFVILRGNLSCIDISPLESQSDKCMYLTQMCSSIPGKPLTTPRAHHSIILDPTLHMIMGFLGIASRPCNRTSSTCELTMPLRQLGWCLCIWSIPIMINLHHNLLQAREPMYPYEWLHRTTSLIKHTPLTSATPCTEWGHSTWYTLSINNWKCTDK